MNSDSTLLAQEVSPRVRGVLLKNLSDFQTELARIEAAYIPAVPVWDLRKSLPALIFRSMRRVQDLRIRGKELGISFPEMHFSRSVAGRELLDLLCEAENPAELCEGAVIIVGAALVAAIEAYLKRNDSVYDAPTAPLLEADRDELKAQIAWAKHALPELAAAGCASAPGWSARVEFAAHGLADALVSHVSRAANPVKAARQIGTLPIARARLPERFRELEFGPDPLPATNEYAQRERYHAVNFLQEVQATDSCASMLFEAPDMPWEFYLDLSRHMWDESRHAAFGERKLTELGSSAAEAGLSTKAYDTRQTLAPVDRYAALTTQEADAFPGKHIGLKDALAHGDTLSSMAWSYDIADETQHVRFGTKWLPVMIERLDDPRSVAEVQADARRWRETVLAEVYNPAAASFRK